MTTKTTKKQAESTPEPTTDAPPASNGVGLTADLGELTADEKALIAAVRSPERDSMTQADAAQAEIDDLAHTLEQLSPENYALFSGMVDAATRLERAKESAIWEKRRKVERQRKLKRAREMRAGIELDDVERISLSLIGALAMNYDITRESVYENGLESLFRCIDKTLRAGLAHADFDDLEVIVEAERAGTSTAPKMWGYGDDDESDDDESREPVEADGDGE